MSFFSTTTGKVLTHTAALVAGAAAAYYGGPTAAKMVAKFAKAAPAVAEATTVVAAK